ncbi:hypothetical protein FHX42_002281 [Saccharopolyspora lacisalsi]|uniref:Uncharacterized protein n=1 Tax=Halosaccharopolyspora lacisalsi TaxID=1000566 RepID=A0A839DTW5_9PSEU|nr:hypothetical protein [Halosaccharopolyspora lacisalsi]
MWVSLLVLEHPAVLRCDVFPAERGIAGTGPGRDGLARVSGPLGTRPYQEDLGRAGARAPAVLTPRLPTMRAHNIT